MGNNKDIDQIEVNPLAHYLESGFDDGLMPRSDSSVLERIPNSDIHDANFNYKNWRLPCIIDCEAISSSEQINYVTATINETDATAAILNRNSPDWLIVFSGINENFHYLNKMQAFWGNVLFLRDTSSTYYSHNPSLPNADFLSSYIDYLTGPRLGKTILLGQSAGGHAALYQSAYVAECLTFSFSPPVLHRDAYSYNIYFEQGIKKLNPTLCTPDLVAHLKMAPRSPRYVVVAKSESTHDETYYWGDAVSAGMIASTGKCSVIVVNRKEHPTLQYLDSRKFFNLLHENYGMFLNNSRSASELFCASNLYYSKV